ncbi:MAG: hypothetical protein C5B60_01545 [Chloroflexi bacterium]|nr:MAG: hypothetical protein C5B60_01545 [Chloroflexota bacterium]
MARFTVNNRMVGTQQPNTTTFKSQVVLTAAATPLGRGSLVDVSLGPDGAPNATDCQIVYDLSRCTTAGTGTAATPNPLDNQVGAAVSAATVNCTAEPTVAAAANLYTVALNQRSSLRVFFDQGMRWPSTANAGIAARSLSPTYAANTLINTIFDE